MKPGAAGEKQISKAALKNQKRREAKKAAKQVHVFLMFNKLYRGTFNSKWCLILIQEIKPDEAPPPVADSTPASHVTSSFGDPETDKKIKNLKKVYVWNMFTIK